MNIVLNKYATAILQFVLVLVVALQAALSGGLDLVEVWQLAALTVANIGTYFVPLLKSGWIGLGKTAVAVLGAAVTAIIPLVYGVWTAETFIIVVLAALNALASEAGVAIRLDSVREQLAAPETSNVVPVAVDQPAVTAVEPVNKMGR